MAGVRAAKRYAKGLIQFANESNQAERINQEMIDLKNSIDGSRELAQFLASPILDSKRKNVIGDELFKGFSPTTQNFIHLIINQKRGDILKEITTQYNAMYNLQNKISIAEIVSAVKLDEATTQEILGLAREKMNADTSYIVESKVDPRIIGGFILRVGDKEIDSSIRTRLARLKKEFDKNEYVPKL